MAEEHKVIQEVTFKMRTTAWIVSVVLKLWYATLRFKGTAQELALPMPPHPFIGITWHNRVFFTPMMMQAFRKNMPMTGLVSPSKDGAWLSALFGYFGVDCVRGSSSKRGAQAILELMRRVKGGSSIFITPDGPRGPRYNFKDGVLLVAERSDMQIVIFKMTPRRYITLNSWDRFIIPMPFTSINIRIKRFENYAVLASEAEKCGLTPAKLAESYMDVAP